MLSFDVIKRVIPHISLQGLTATPPLPPRALPPACCCCACTGRAALQAERSLGAGPAVAPPRPHARPAVTIELLHNPHQAAPAGSKLECPEVLSNHPVRCWGWDRRVEEGLPTLTPLAWLLPGCCLPGAPSTSQQPPGHGGPKTFRIDRCQLPRRRPQGLSYHPSLPILPPPSSTEAAVVVRHRIIFFSLKHSVSGTQVCAAFGSERNATAMERAPGCRCLAPNRSHAPSSPSMPPCRHPGPSRRTPCSRQSQPQQPVGVCHDPSAGTRGLACRASLAPDSSAGSKTGEDPEPVPAAVGAADAGTGAAAGTADAAAAAVASKKNEDQLAKVLGDFMIMRAAGQLEEEDDDEEDEFEDGIEGVDWVWWRAEGAAAAAATGRQGDTAAGSSSSVPQAAPPLPPPAPPMPPAASASSSLPGPAAAGGAPLPRRTAAPGLPAAGGGPRRKLPPKQAEVEGSR